MFTSCRSDTFLILFICLVFCFLLAKSYTSVEEENKHKENWLENLKLVQEHNRLADQGIKSYRLGMNYFADMVIKENL